MFRLAVSLLLVAGILVGCSPRTAPYGPEYQLSDDDIATYALKFSQASFRQGAAETQIIGLDNGLHVLADIFYLDDGSSTLGVLHYDVEPGQACKRAGGAVRLEFVPGPASMTRRPYCVPKVLVNRNIQMEPLG
jgi:hypothetical protein